MSVTLVLREMSVLGDCNLVVLLSIFEGSVAEEDLRADL
jgi:hypothetical protein